MKKKIILIGLCVFVLMQLIRPQLNKSAQSFEATKIQDVPNDVQTVLKNNCFDCHSNDTKYPWYGYLQPVAFLLNQHIIEGKAALNFDEFKTYNFKKQYNKIKSIGQQIKDDKMPLKSYRLLHSKAYLSDKEKLLLINWSDSTYNLLKTKSQN